MMVELQLKPRPTMPTAPDAEPIDFGPLPETLATLLGAMAVRKRFIAQTWDDSQEYWKCQRDLAALERRWGEAEKVWAAHIAKEKEK